MSMETLRGAVSVKSIRQKPDWNLSKMFYEVKTAASCLATLFSKTCEIKGSSDIGLCFLGRVGSMLVSFRRERGKEKLLQSLFEKAGTSERGVTMLLMVSNMTLGLCLLEKIRLAK